MSVEILIGDCRNILKEMADCSVDCCVTSPPYFGLRDYGVSSQMGLESTPSDFVAELVSVFREVRRVLRDDGTLWLNLGDSYARQGGTTDNTKDVRQREMGHISFAQRRMTKLCGELKHKDLIGIPWRVALALQADGWYLRQDIIWHKPNAMPESVQDRCTKSHEYIFLLSKSPTYYFDREAIQEPTVARTASGARAPGNTKRTKGGRNYADGAKERRTAANLHEIGAREFRNRRSVWTVSTKPFAEAHFATFPVDLVEPCILAGCRIDGTVLDPFGGAGTTGLAAELNRRNSILIELNPEYAAIARRRLCETDDRSLFELFLETT
jgi:DNA modification methylase